MGKCRYTLYSCAGGMVTFERGKMSLQEMQAAVGGSIELLHNGFKLKNGEIEGDAFGNEEAKLMSLPRNRFFEVYHLDASETITGEPWDDFVSGDVLVEKEILNA